MKKFISFALVLLMISTMSAAVFAAEPAVKDTSDIKRIEVPLDDVLKSSITASTSYTKTLAKDYAISNGQTGAIYSIGQFVDFSSALPAGSSIVSITLYCPTSVTVTQSKYTSIDSFIISNGTDATAVKFYRTNTPSSSCKTTYFAGAAANIKWFVQIKGTVLMQYTGMDGFTVNGGSKMIIEYK